MCSRRSNSCYPRRVRKALACRAGPRGPRLLADTGQWGTYAWSEHVLGAPGYRIAGGSDEIQRNIIGERVLGLPAEPRSDKDLPFSQAGKVNKS